jgi:cobalt/nickel transport system permease protein
MHIPNGYLGSNVCAGSLALAASGLLFAAQRVLAGMALPPGRIIAAAAAAIFAAQAVNFPVAGGTSGHLLGATLAVLIAGPFAAAWILTAVVAVQCFLFGDGGIQSLGANVLNLAILAPLSAHWLLLRFQTRAATAEGQLVVIGFASWFSVMIAAAAAAIELAISATAPLSSVLPAMLLAHAKIGIGEALITASVAFLLFDLVPGASPHGYELAMPRRTGQLLGGLMLMAGIAVILTPFASAHPDGLEAIAAQLGFGSLETAATFALFSPSQASPMGILTVLATSTAGVMAVALLVLLANRLIRSVRG